MMSSASSNSQPLPVTGTVTMESQQRTDVNVVEDTNNNTSLNDRERPAEVSAIESNPAQHSPSVREIHKNSWLKRMPCVDKWSGKFPKSQKLEKFWVVFCVHDDKEAFLEFYENRRSAYSHIPLSNVSLSKCLHISPTIVAQGNDHEFVITLETQVIRLAASTNEQMLEWMDTMCTKLREMGILEPKDNLYSKEPINTKSVLPSEMESAEPLSREEFNRLTIRDPNSPLPPVPGTSLVSTTITNIQVSNSTVVYVRNPSVRNSTQNTSINNSVINSVATIETLPSSSSHSVPESVFNFEVASNSEQASSVSRRSSISQTSPTISSETEQRTPPLLTSSAQEQTSIYEPLFYSGATNLRLGIRNPSYENPPHPQRHIVFKPTPALPPRPSSDALHTSSIASDVRDSHSNVRTSNLGHLSSTSEPSLNGALQSTSAFVSDSTNRATSSSAVLLRTQSHVESVSGSSERTSHASSSERVPHNGLRVLSSHSFKNTTLPVDENGRPLSLREVQVQKLQSEISHKSGVRLVLRKKDCINAIAFVECFNSVWVAGWKQKEHPLLHNTFHVGDRIISIAGHRIQYVYDVHRVIKQQSSTVEFVVRRVPCGKVLAIKREYDGQDLGIIREGGTAEIKEVKPNGLAANHGLTAKATSVDGNSLCNWAITEINHRPLNLFFKDNEIQDRLNAIGLDISILVQPLELVRAMKKQLKTFKSYKDYIVQ